MGDFNDPQQAELNAEPCAEQQAHETQINREAYRNRLKLLLQDSELTIESSFILLYAF